MSARAWYYGWRDVVASWPDGGQPPATPLIPWEQTARQRLASAIDDETWIESLVRDPNLYRFAAQIEPQRISVSGGRPRQYPEWALVLFGCVKVVKGSGHAAERYLAPPARWQRLVDIAATVLGSANVLGLPDRGPKYSHYLTFGNEHVSEAEITRLTSAFEQFAAWRAVEVGLYDPREKFCLFAPNTRVSRLHAVAIDGKVHSSPSSKTKAAYADTATGEIKAHRIDDARGQWVEGGDEKNFQHGSKFTWAMGQHTMANIRIVLSLRHMPPASRLKNLPRKERDAHRPSTEADHFGDMATRIAELLPGAHVFLFDGAWRGRHTTTFQTATGRAACSRMAVAPKNTPHLVINGYRWKARAIPLGPTHPSAKWNCSGHELIAAAGALWERRLDAQGGEQFTLIERLANKRQIKWNKTEAASGWHFNAQFTFNCHHTGHQHTWWESLSQSHADDLADFNRGEYLRLAPVFDPEHVRVYPWRAAVESLNSTSEHTWWRNRLMAWGSHRQTLDMFMFGLAMNTRALVTYTTYATIRGASLPWNPVNPSLLVLAAYPAA